MSNHSSYFTYIILCADDTYYTGKTPSLSKRMRQHNGEISGGAKYTHGRRPVILKYFEEYPSHKLAASREFELKKLSHKEKEKLCSIKKV